MTTKITGKVYDTTVSLHPRETLQLGNLHITNTHDFSIKLHLDYQDNVIFEDPDFYQELTPQGLTFEQQWER